MADQKIYCVPIYKGITVTHSHQMAMVVLAIVIFPFGN